MKTRFLRLLVMMSFVFSNKSTILAQQGIIQIGQRVPDISLGDIYASPHEYNSIGDLKGKLVILDFWNTWCVTCIAAFPKLNAIQEAFGDSIKIFLINGSENKQQIEERFKKMRIDEADYPHLSFVASGKALKDLFPHQTVPHHVWIDTSGVLTLVGSALNTHRDKIRKALYGEGFTYLNNSNTSFPWNPNTSLHDIFGAPAPRKLPSSLLTGHNNEYGAMASVFFEGVSMQGILGNRDSYFNHEVAELYYHVFKKEIAHQHSNVIYSGKFSAGTSYYWLDYCDIHYTDTVKLTNGFIPSSLLTDEQFVASRYCYEQVLPIDMIQTEKNRFMLDQLNSYFGPRLNIRGKLIEREVECYVLTTLERTKEPERITAFENTALKDKLQYSVYHLFREKEVKMPFIIDETDLDESDVVKLPSFFESMEALEAELGKIGVKVRMTKRKLKFMVISDCG